jgi:multiple sugar transport system ATP-binding protein
MPELKLISIEKSFKERKVLSGITIDISDGELLVVLGPSGCGKSTILRIVAGLEQQDSGEIYIGRHRVDNLSSQKRNCALVFQNYALYPHMTVENNLAFPLKAAKVSKHDIKKRVLEIAELIDLPDRLKAYPSELSGGQRQRVALGRALVRKPDIFLLDEPLSNLDTELRSRMRHDIVKLVKELGVTTIYVTHDQTEALTMADRMAVLDSGFIHQTGTVNEIYDRPADIFVASFVGTPKINLIKGWISDNLIRPINIPALIIPDKFSMREITLGIRAESIKFDPNGQFSGIVTGVEYLGDRCLVELEYLDQQIIVSATPDNYRQGTTLRFKIPSDKILVFDRENGHCLTN